MAAIETAPTGEEIKMKAVQLAGYECSNEVLALNDVEIPEPDAGKLRIKVRAAALNPLDYRIRNGEMKLAMKYAMPHGVGFDVAGIVDKIGPGVSSVSIGDEVYGRVDSSLMGTVAEYCLARAEDVALKPASLSFEEAASIPLVALTSWQAIIEPARGEPMKQGAKVLIHAGAGGIGTSAIQLAKLHGAEIWTTTSTKNVELVSGLGADHVIDYKQSDYRDICKDLDLVFDTLGGDTTMDSLKCLKPGGRLVAITGVPTREFAIDAGLPWILQMVLGFGSRKLTGAAKNLGVSYDFIGMEPNAEQLKIIAGYVEQGQFKATIDSTYKLEDFAKAYERQESGRARGKVVFSIAENE